MLTDTLDQESISDFPSQRIATILKRPEQDIQAYYENWKQSRNAIKFDQAFIAGLVGQSKTTISNYINQRFRNISTEKQQVLQQIIEALDYKPSQSAQLIRAKEKKVIGVVANITQTPSRDYSSSILEGIKIQANKYHYGLVIYDVTQSEQQSFIQRMPFLGLTDGLIIIGSMLRKEDYLQLAKQDIPLVLINPWSKVPSPTQQNSIVASIKADLVGLDNLFRHYAAQVQKPLLFTIGIDKYKQRQKKIEMFQKYFASQGEIAYLENYSITAVEKIKSQINFARYDAFFCLADLVAICIKQHIEQLGLTAPVTGYDSTDLAKVMNIPTVDHNIIQQGSESFSKLLLALSY